MKATVRVTITTPGPLHAKALSSSLEPDNVDFPDGLSMEMKVEGKSLLLSFTSESLTDTLISTVDEVFEACGTSLTGIEVSRW